MWTGHVNTTGIQTQSPQDSYWFEPAQPPPLITLINTVNSAYNRLGYSKIVEMVSFRSYWSHLDISTTICPPQMAVVGFELMTFGFRGMAPTHCGIGADRINSGRKKFKISDETLITLTNGANLKLNDLF